MKDLLEGTSRRDLEAARQAVASGGWAADVLSKQEAGGYWVDGDDLYRPKYLATNWMLLILSDLGLTKDDPRIDKACRLWMKRFSARDGGFEASKKGEARHGHLCITGNTTRALVKFGYEDHPRVRRAFEWFVRNQAELGGWSCWNFGSRPKGRNLDSWEPLSAFAVYPRQKWTRGMKAAVERGCEYYLSRELCRQGESYAPWLRFHFPCHYYYDVLVGLDFITALGYVDERRLGLAVSHLKKKRRKNGQWNLDAVHPDLDNDGKWPKWWEQYRDRFHPFALEEVGRPSKMITLRALTVLKRIGEFESPHDA